MVHNYQPLFVLLAVNPTAAEWYTYTPSSNFNVTITTDIAANTPRVDTELMFTMAHAIT